MFLQAFGQREKSFIVVDFNHDGVVDTLRSFYLGGSGFGGRSVTVINGKTNETFEFDTYGCFCSIKKTVLIPPVLNDPGNILFLDVMKKEILPEEKSFPDASLRWIIDATFSKKDLKKSKYFDLIIDSRTEWSKGPVELPSTYYISLKGDTLNQLIVKDPDFPEWYDKKTNRGFLIYYGHNHFSKRLTDSLLLVTGDRNYEVYRSSHGVLIKKDESYKWVFISDVDLTGAPGKLRWRSIGSVELLDKYIIIKQELLPNESYKLFLINIETGICGRFKFDFYAEVRTGPDETGPFLIKGETIILSIEGKQTFFKLNDIFENFEALYISKN